MQSCRFYDAMYKTAESEFVTLIKLLFQAQKERESWSRNKIFQYQVFTQHYRNFCHF